MNVPRTVCLGFLIVIVVGAILLMMPFSITPDGLATIKNPIDYAVRALFTSTSAVCVTGLSVVDVGKFYTFWGQLFLCALVQIGGLGYMTATTFLLIFFGRRLGLRDKIALQQSLDVQALSGLGQLVRSIIGLTLIFEITGIFLLLLVFVPHYGLTQGLWLAIFHSVNSFNNAGFSTFSNSFMDYVTSPLLVAIVTGLIILGGLGYQTIMELYLWGRGRLSKTPNVPYFSLNFKIAMSTTIVLVLVGFIAFFNIEFNNPNTFGNLTFGQKILAAWFQAVTPRTAGFNTIDIGKMTTTGLFLTIALMFIGTNPGSTGGGIKTTTTRLLLSCTGAALKGRDQVIIYERHIPTVLLLKAVGVAFGSLLVVIASTTLITLTEGNNQEFITIFFEVVSAFATVGLSMGITANLSILAKLILIVTMYIGRVGILLLIASLRHEPKPQTIRYPEENLLVG